MNKLAFDLIIVTPVFNDWTSLNRLIQDIVGLQGRPNSIMVLAVNDASIEPVTIASTSIPVEVLHLVRNLGHQKAIAVGVSFCVTHYQFKNLVVMDADGEDQPKYIADFLETAASTDKNKIIFAKRIKRRESFVFKAFYRLYKFLFKILTGISITFGNYCMMSYDTALKVSYMSDIWNHFSAAIIKSRTPYILIPTERGKRYNGKSQMNYQNLILHGLSSLSVHIDIVAVRLILACILFLGLALIGIAVIAWIKLFTDLAIPGWASNVILGFSILIIQLLFFSIFLVFIVLSYRTQRHFVPKQDFVSMVNFTKKYGVAE